MLLRARFPTLDLRDASPFVDQLRTIKSASELALMREAGRLSGLGVLEAMRSTAPGVMEYELGALAEFIFLRGGAFGSAYEQIVAAGENIWYGHYGAKSAKLEAGQLVLMDAAPDYRYYASDIGRMWPVTGEWQPWQLELYGFIVRYHVELLERIRPGVTNVDVLEGAADVMRDVIDESSFSKPIYEQAVRKEPRVPLPPLAPCRDVRARCGGVPGRTVRPGAGAHRRSYDLGPEEKLYIRVEDTVAITEDGIENFTGFVPFLPDEVIATMSEPGLLQTFTPR